MLAYAAEVRSVSRAVDTKDAIDLVCYCDGRLGHEGNAAGWKQIVRRSRWHR